MGEALLQVRRLAGTEIVMSRPARYALAVATFALLTALGAYIAVPLPGTPVPVTFQTLAVILAGALLGPRLGAASQLAYLAAGAAGLPVFSAARAGLLPLLGPTGGYLLAFPLAAYVVGRVAGTGRVGTPRLALALSLGAATILAGGTAQLALLTGESALALALGLAPFLWGDALKILSALLIAGRLRSRTLGRS
jgi:biotin transport system substrate-specific component